MTKESTFGSLLKYICFAQGTNEISSNDQDEPQHVKKLKRKRKGRTSNRRRKFASPGEEAPPEDDEYEPGTPIDGPPDGEEIDFEDEGHGAPEEPAEGKQIA